jgi:hypothetical protein
MGLVQQGLQPVALPLCGETPIYSSGSESFMVKLWGTLYVE